ncbi:MAG: hypothetical protein ABIP27_14645 [Flavobacterium circumlabens]|uniref:hypothetical protein n=1 Tax=Flavobacterium circumlabens TaxID=2133765 RepID=UPI003267103B
METTELRRITLLSIQRALLGMISPHLRAVGVGFNGTEKLIVTYYLDREPGEEDYENLSDVSSEVLADIEFSSVEENCIFSSDEILKLNNLDSWAYKRKED